MGAHRPPLDDLATVLAVLVTYSTTKERVCEWTGLSHEQVSDAVGYLKRRRIVRHLGGGHWQACQRECAGTCGRQGNALKGRSVDIDPETLRWFCSDCWDAEAERVRRLVNTSD